MNKADTSNINSHGSPTEGAESLPELLQLISWNRFWILNCFFITTIGTVLRFVLLELRPMHHDEGVNGHFLITLFREGVYKYDPSNYHGPDLYYLSLAFVKFFGLNTLSVRSSVAIFGVLTVVLAFFLRRYIGSVGSLAAALFLSLSPGMVYISRYFIHEILFVFLSLGLVVAVVFFIEKRSAGIFAAAWLAALLLVCFLPSALTLAGYIGGENPILLWLLRIGIFAVEAVLVFFVMRMLLAWDNGRPIYLLLASASLVLMFATKETAFITIGTMLIACICVWAWQRMSSSKHIRKNRYTILLYTQGVLAYGVTLLGYIYIDRVKSFYKWFYTVFASPDVPDQRFLFYTILLLLILGFISWIVFFLDSKEDNEEVSDDFFEPTWGRFRAGLGDGKNTALIIFAAVLVFAYVGVLFFSSFFTYPEGVKKAFEAYAIWTQTGSKDHTQNGMIAYVKWLAQIESPLIILSVLGTLIAFLKARHRFAMFTGLWAFGLFLAYTIIPYKTPWLALSFTLPMCIAAGYAINELARSKQVLHKALAAMLSLLAIFILLYQTYDHNFVRYDSDRMPYIYAHTERGFDKLISDINRYAVKSGKDDDATVEIVSNDYWPMPWYMRDNPNARFHGRLVPSNASEMIVASKEQLGELEGRYGAHYKYVGTYPLRPGVTLYLLVRSDLADGKAKSIGMIPVE